jgi:cell division protein FtsB
MTRQQMPDTAGDSWPGRQRPRFTSRAAVLVVVVCAIALSLAYPVREYLAQLRQIDQLQAQQAQIAAQVRQLMTERNELGSPGYVEQQARERLHMCLPAQTCYVIISPRKHAVKAVPGQRAATPWYGRLWSSVHEADKDKVAPK